MGNVGKYRVGKGSDGAGEVHEDTKVQGNEHTVSDSRLKSHGFEPFNLSKE